MADRSSSLLKRPHPEADDDVQKRARSNDGSPRPTTPSQGKAPLPKQDVNQMLAAAKARAAELKARMAGSKPNPASTAASQQTAPSTPSTNSLTSDKIAAMRARVAAATSRANSQRPSAATTYTPQVHNDDMSKARGGLDIGLHPSLLADTQPDKNRTPQTKFATVMGNRRADSLATQKKAQLDLSGPSVEEIKSNPYFDANIGSAMAKSRVSRPLIFNEKGKYIQQAAALRRQAQLEAMKKRIAERARLAGLEEDLDTDKAFVVPAPPDIEWWDEGLVNGSSYAAISNPANLKIDTPDSIITLYIQHPVLIEPPQEKHNPAPKPMFLTSKEQAKLRRQRRQADLKEQQAKVRLGLEPPPPPKVKKGNLMLVLGQEAVKDPTAVEARVNREIAERKQQHEDTNENRKLNKEERAEKLARQRADDLARGIHVRVYKINSLANVKHRFQIFKNAEDRELTGVCIAHPKFNLLVVEGGEYDIRHYDHLIQKRIRWTEMEAPRAVSEGNREALTKWLEAEDEDGNLKDLSLNRCECIFSGEEKERTFRKVLRHPRACETDAQARDVLGPRMEGFWNVAKGWKSDDF